MSSKVFFTMRQFALVGLAALAYFGVRGLTEGEVEQANEQAEYVLKFERLFGLDFELTLQEWLKGNEALVNLANWIYIWGHWPVVAGTLVWLATRHRRAYFELRNAMFISGAIGLVIFATFAVTPPRLFGSEYVDTVSERSISYRVLQPPALVNKYAAVPSLHFGWNLLVGLSWRKVGRNRLARVAGVVMPVAMAFAVVATANHWTFDVLSGAAVAVSGLALERARRRYISRRITLPVLEAPRASTSPDARSSQSAGSPSSR